MWYLASSRNCKLCIEPTNSITEGARKQEAFQIAYSLVEHVNDYEYVVELETIPLLVLDTEEVTKKYSPAEFLINILLNEPQKSEYFRDKTLKGLRNNYFYIADITQNTLQDINADDNGAYKQIRNTSTMFYCKRDKFHTVYRTMKSCTIIGRSRLISMKKSLFPVKRLLLCIDDTVKQRVFL